MINKYKKGPSDPNNHDDVVTHPEPDILNCEVKQALRSTTMNKASGDDGIPAELLQILKDIPYKEGNNTQQLSQPTTPLQHGSLRD